MQEFVSISSQDEFYGFSFWGNFYGFFLLQAWLRASRFLFKVADFRMSRTMKLCCNKEHVSSSLPTSRAYFSCAQCKNLNLRDENGRLVMQSSSHTIGDIDYDLSGVVILFCFLSTFLCILGLYVHSWVPSYSISGIRQGNVHEQNCV